MPKKQEPRLFYNPMPQEDLKSPPIKEPDYVFTDSRTLDETKTQEDVSRLLSNLAFS